MLNKFETLLLSAALSTFLSTQTKTQKEQCMRKAVGESGQFMVSNLFHATVGTI